MALEEQRGDYFDDLEVMAPRQRQKYQREALRKVIDRAYRSSPAARAIFDGAGVSPEQVRSVKDLEKLPVTRKADLIEMQRKSPPYGGLLAMPPEEIERVFISPGPIYEPLHTANIKWFAKSFYAAGFRKGDVVVNTFTYHMSPAGILFHEALRDCGASVAVMGTGNTDILLQTMRDLHVNGFVGTPSFLMSVIKRAEETGRDFKADFKLARAWFTGEMLAPSLRQTFEETYGISTAQAYAVTEPGGALAYECREKNGLHLMDEYLIEIADPATGKQLGPGEVGEIVVTPLHNETWGLVRFGTGDMSSFTAEPCPCGRTSSRLTGIIGRMGDAVKVRGMFVVAKQAEEVVMSFPQVSRFQMVVSREEERDYLTLKLEMKRGMGGREKLADDLNDKFQNICRVKIDRIEFLSPGIFPEGCKKLLDERKWD